MHSPIRKHGVLILADSSFPRPSSYYWRNRLSLASIQYTLTYYADLLCLRPCDRSLVHVLHIIAAPDSTLWLLSRRRMPLPSFPFVMAATTSVKKSAISARAAWRAFSFMKKVASDDWDWSELAQMLTSHLEHSPDHRSGIEHTAILVLVGCVAFWTSFAAITYIIWRKKSRAMRERIAALTWCLNEAEETIRLLSEGTHVKAW